MDDDDEEEKVCQSEIKWTRGREFNAQSCTVYIGGA